MESIRDILAALKAGAITRDVAIQRFAEFQFRQPSHQGEGPRFAGDVWYDEGWVAEPDSWNEFAGLASGILSPAEFAEVMRRRSEIRDMATDPSDQAEPPPIQGDQAP